MDGVDLLRGDIVLVPFPYVTDFKRAKTRPALIIQNNVGNRFGSTVIVWDTSRARPCEKRTERLPSASTCASRRAHDRRGNKGDTKTALAACAAQAAILDEFPPYAWLGATACSSTGPTATS